MGFRATMQTLCVASWLPKRKAGTLVKSSKTSEDFVVFGQIIPFEQ